MITTNQKICNRKEKRERNLNVTLNVVIKVEEKKKETKNRKPVPKQLAKWQ